jgi:hypothetical protein
MITRGSLLPSTPSSSIRPSWTWCGPFIRSSGRIDKGGEGRIFHPALKLQIFKLKLNKPVQLFCQSWTYRCNVKTEPTARCAEP